MGLDRTRAYLLSLPFVEETLQWDNLVYWVLDKAAGGRMFAMLPPDMNRPHVVGFAAQPESYNDLLEMEGVRPAPYLARAHWVIVERWDVFAERDLHEHLRAAYERVEAKLPPRVQRIMQMKPSDYRKLVRERRDLQAVTKK